MASLPLAGIALASAVPLILQPAPSVLPPPIVTTSPIGGEANPPQPWLTRYEPGEARCGGAVEAPRHSELPLPAAELRYRPPPGREEQLRSSPVRLRFRIDASGRPLGIEAGQGGQGGYSANPSDLIPAFATWRFKAGADRSGCEIQFQPRSMPIQRADMADVYRYTALARPGQAAWNSAVARAAFERSKPAGTDCFDPSPRVRMRAFPAFEEIEQPAGTLSHSFLLFDIDASGQPEKVRVVGSSGNSDLDNRSLKAVRQSRFAPGKRKGCSYFYWRGFDEPLPAPPAPEERAYRAQDANCPDDENSPWKTLPALHFPQQFQSRGIEGWAIVRFDVAPWGEVGNVSVAAAEPAAAFGEQAAAIVRRARKAESQNGYRGCVTRVIFRMPDGRKALPEASAE